MVLQGLPRLLVGWAVELAMAGMNLFMLVWGVRLVHITWFQAISDFPLVSVGISYLPVPLGGAITLLFVVERLWTGRLFQEPAEEELAPVSVD
jgi:TRAP-type C4-dicarboxylate transport system permease small subunit